MHLTFDPNSVGTVYRVPYQQRAAAAVRWARANDVRPAGADERRVALLLIDCQNTFCLPEFELFVPGAVEDNRRLCSFIYRNLGAISLIHATLDTHTAHQIFHAAWWIDPDGRHPDPMTVISADDVQRGVWRADPSIDLPGVTAEERQAHAAHYVAALTGGGKFPLIIWPYHAIRGGIGNAMVSAVEEACFVHAVARRAPTRFHVKGDHPLTEHYSALAPEVTTDHTGRALAARNESLVDALLACDAVYVAGQAKSHCVAWTVGDLLSAINERDPALAGRIHLLEDCTSSVVVPGVVDFTDAGNEAFARFAGAGMQVVSSDASVF